MPKKSKRGVSAATQRRQDQAALPEARGPKLKGSPASKAKQLLSEPIVGGPGSSGFSKVGKSSKVSGGNWRSEPRDSKGRFRKR